MTSHPGKQLGQQGQAALTDGHPQEALQLLRQAVAVTPDDQWRDTAQWLMGVAAAYEDLGQPQDGRPWLAQGLARAQLEKDKVGESVFLMAIGVSHELTGDLEQALNYGQQAYEVACQAGIAHLQASCLIQMTEPLLYSNRGGEARSNLAQISDIVEASSSASLRSQYHGHCGKVLLSDGQLGAAREAYQLAARYAGTIQEPRDLMIWFSDLGCVEALSGNVAQGLEYCQRALDVARRFQSLPRQAHCLRCMGRIHQAGGDHAAARRAYTEAQVIYQRYGSHQYLEEIAHYLAAF